MAHVIVNKVKACRDKLPWPWRYYPSKVADRLGVTRSYYNMIEAGKRVPALPMALVMAATFGVSVTDLFELSKAPPAIKERDRV